MRQGARLLLLAAALTLIACSPEAEKKKPPQNPETPAPSVPAQPAAPAILIRDGIGVGGVELGMSPAEVEARMGKPDRVNKAGNDVVFMAFHEPENFGVYFDPGHVRMLIVSQKHGACTDYDVCLYREGDLAKLKAHHGSALFRFVDRDGSITYRLLEKKGGAQIMTEYTPSDEAHDGIVQVSILYWNGKIDTSSFD